MENLETEIEKQKAYSQTAYRFYGYGIWGIFEKSSGNLIGRCGIEQKMIDGQAEYEISYLIDTAHQRQGYALECMRAVLAYAEYKLHIKRLAAVIHKDNLPSLRLIERLGFRREKSLFYEGMDCYLYSMPLERNKLRTASLAVKEKYQKAPDTSVYGKRYQS